MINSIKGLLLTLVSTMNGLRSPVTRQYPSTGTLWKREEAPTPVQDRFMGFPALTWDGEIEEPFCTSCMVCIRHCPTQCMTATMKDNPLQQEGKIPVLLEIGTKFQRETGWIPPTKRAKPEPEAAPAVAGDGETEGSESSS